MMGFNVIWLLTYLFHHSQKPPPNSFGCKPQAVKGMSKKKKKKREVTTLLPSENLGANQVSWRVGDENCTEVFVLLPFQGRELSMNHSERTLKGLLPSPEN